MLMAFSVTVNSLWLLYRKHLYGSSVSSKSNPTQKSFASHVFKDKHSCLQSSIVVAL